MGNERDAARQLDRTQKAIEYILAVVIPGLLAVMLYSYVLFDGLFTPLFVIVLAVAVLTIVPAYRTLDLHYRCWAKNTMPQRLVTGLIGTIYISAAAVFGVSLISSSKGLDPEQPLTFGVFGLFAILLIVIMAHNARYKERNERTELRFYRRDPAELAAGIKSACESKSAECSIVRAGGRTAILLPDRSVSIVIRKHNHESSEVMMECGDPVSADLCAAIKETLDQEA